MITAMERGDIRRLARARPPGYDVGMNDLHHAMAQSIERSAALIGALNEHVPTLARLAETMVGCLERGGKVMTCGYGGSAADALHLAEELTGRFDADRPSLPAVALVADPTLMTCIANDYGFDRVFSRQIEGLGRDGDVLVIFSTSGRSPGLTLALEAAQTKGITVLALLGKGGGALAGRADVELIVDSNETARIQEVHTLILHLLLEAVERKFTA